MTAGRLAMLGATGAVVLWAAKATAIGIAGGLDRSPLEGPLFVAGLLSALVGAGALGVWLLEGRPAWVRGLGAVGAIVALVLSAGIGGSVAAALQPDDPGWVWGEVNLWVSALVLAAAALVQRSRVPSNA
jgi:hypothetical protein